MLVVLFDEAVGGGHVFFGVATLTSMALGIVLVMVVAAAVVVMVVLGVVLAVLGVVDAVTGGGGENGGCSLSL